MPSEMKNSIAEIKSIIEGMKSRVSDTESHKSDLENRIMEIIQSEHQKERQIKKKMEAA